MLQHPELHFVFGYEQALTSLLEDPGKALALLERLTAASVTWAVAQARHGVDELFNERRLAGLDHLNLDLLALGPLHGGRHEPGRLIRHPNQPLLGPLGLRSRVTEGIPVHDQEPQVGIIAIHRLTHPPPGVGSARSTHAVLISTDAQPHTHTTPITGGPISQCI